MAYPPAPWTLKGYALQTLQPIKSERVQSFIPSELEVVSLWPGQTLGGLYVAAYGLGSTLEYNELIVIGAVVRYGNQLGAWISHIYVDHPDSVAGGREIWGLPKALAQFTWGANNQSVQVHQGEQLLCDLSRTWKLPGWRQTLSFSAFSTLGLDLLCFEAKSNARLCLAGMKVQVPATSSIAALGLDQPWLGGECQNLHLVAEAPQVVGQLASSFER